MQANLPTLKVLDWRSNYRRRNSNSVGLRLKFRTCEVLWSGINLPKLETQKIFTIQGNKIISLTCDNLRQSAEIERVILTLPEAEIETPRIRSQWEDGQNAMNSWRRAEGPTSVGSGDTILLMATHTPLERHLSLLCKIFPSRAVSLDILNRQLGETQCKEKQKVN